MLSFAPVLASPRCRSKPPQPRGSQCRRCRIFQRRRQGCAAGRDSGGDASCCSGLPAPGARLQFLARGSSLSLQNQQCPLLSSLSFSLSDSDLPACLSHEDTGITHPNNPASSPHLKCLYHVCKAPWPCRIIPLCSGG